MFSMNENSILHYVIVLENLTKKDGENQKSNCQTIPSYIPSNVPPCSITDFTKEVRRKIWHLSNIFYCFNIDSSAQLHTTNISPLFACRSKELEIFKVGKE